MSHIINRHLYLIKNSQFLHNIFPDGSILAAYKRFQNLKNLLVCGDPCNIRVTLVKKVFRWFRQFQKEEKVFLPVFLHKSFVLNCFFICSLHFK